MMVVVKQKNDAAVEIEPDQPDTEADKYEDIPNAPNVNKNKNI